MNTWIPAALLSLFGFGLWGLFRKLAILYIDARSALIYQTIGVALIGLMTLSLVHFKPATDSRGLIAAIFTGLAYAGGSLFYFIAAEKGKIMTVVTLTALYPVITIILSVALVGYGNAIK